MQIFETDSFMSYQLWGKLEEVADVLYVRVGDMVSNSLMYKGE